MHKYDITDFQPKPHDESTADPNANTVDYASVDDDEAHAMEQLDLSPEQSDTPEAPARVGHSPSSPAAPAWSRYLSAFSHLC